MLEKLIKSSNVYVLFLLLVYNFANIYDYIFGIQFKTFLFVAITAIAVFFAFLKFKAEKIDEKKISSTDLAIDGGLVAAIIYFGYLRIKNSLNIEFDLMIVGIALMGFVLTQYKTIGKKEILLFNVSNCLVYIMVIINYIASEWFAKIQGCIINGDGIVSWLVLGIAVSIFAYCIYDELKILNGITAAAGAFLLFVEKNIVSIIIIEAVILALPFLFKPTKKLVMSAAQLFFGFNFLLCNMSLLTGYVEWFKGIAAYDLEVSVYLELVLAVIGVVFFTLWDKFVKEDDSDEKLLTQMKGFFTGLISAVMIFVFALFTAAVKGTSVVLPEIINKLLPLFNPGIASEKGLFVISQEVYGTIGVLIVFAALVLLVLVAVKTIQKESKEQKMFSVLTIVFVLQSIFLNQTVISMPLYAAFIIINIYMLLSEKTALKAEAKTIEEE